MYWVIQGNIYSEEGFERLLTALDRLGVRHGVHKVVPFVGTLEPEPEIPEGGRVIVMGSYSLARQARARGWEPGAFLDNLDFEVHRLHWGERMLNVDARIFPFAQVPFQDRPFFIRPVLDTKVFTGHVSDWADYTERRDGLLRPAGTADPASDPPGLDMLTAATPVMVCTKKQVYSETRTWVVDGKVVTASGYKLGTITRYTPPEEVEPRIIAYVQECVALWTPNRAFVLDVADTPEGLKIVEVNNLNSAGFYKADMNRLVLALESMDP